MLCSDISKDEDCVCFPSRNPAARLPHGLVFGGRFTGLSKYIIRTHTYDVRCERYFARNCKKFNFSEMVQLTSAAAAPCSFSVRNEMNKHYIRTYFSVSQILILHFQKPCPGDYFCRWGLCCTLQY